MKYAAILRNLFFAFLAFYSVGASAKALNIITWDIEHLGAEGRGSVTGFGAGNLPLRNDTDLYYIAGFIEEVLKPDILAIQDIAITGQTDGVSSNKQLDKIMEHLGPEWKYQLAPKKDDHNTKSLYNGFIWNTNSVRPLNIAPIPFNRIDLAGGPLYDSLPLIGYFEAIGIRGEAANDFALVNVQLAEGVHKDENHLIAITLIEFHLTKLLEDMGVKEEDRIILGNFNDNPYLVDEEGYNIYSPAMYQHMEFKGYRDYVSETSHSTRMDQKLNQVIDHILANKAARKHIQGEDTALIWLPNGGVQEYPAWRKTYSDHFPVRIKLRVSYDDDED